MVHWLGTLLLTNPIKVFSDPRLKFQIVRCVKSIFSSMISYLLCQVAYFWSYAPKTLPRLYTHATTLKVLIHWHYRKSFHFIFSENIGKNNRIQLSRRPCSLPTQRSPLQIQPQIFYLGLLFPFYLFVYYLSRYLDLYCL